MPWEFKVGGEIVSCDLAPVFCTNHIDLEARAVVAGEAIGQRVDEDFVLMARDLAKAPRRRKASARR